jgi:hypothetical protein
MRADQYNSYFYMKLKFLKKWIMIQIINSMFCIFLCNEYLTEYMETVTSIYVSCHLCIAISFANLDECL